MHMFLSLSNEIKSQREPVANLRSEVEPAELACCNPMSPSPSPLRY